MKGFLTKIKIRLVNGEQLAFLSKKLEFYKYVLLSSSIEEKYMGRSNINILEDVFESFIGALYLDSNDYTMIQKFVVSVYEEYIDFPRFNSE